MGAREAVRQRAAQQRGEVERPRPAELTIMEALSDPDVRSGLIHALPQEIGVDRFLRIARTAVKLNPYLMDCTSKSFVAALHKAAQLGLEPGGTGQCYLTKYGRNVQLVLGYRGIITLARRSGDILSIEAREVHENDEFEYEYGLDAKLRHKPHIGGGRGEVICYYGLAKFTNGGWYFVVVDLDEIERHKQMSETGRQNKGPWREHPVAMARKTVIRIMEPYLPLTIEAREAIVNDETYQTDLEDVPHHAGDPIDTTAAESNGNGAAADSTGDPPAEAETDPTAAAAQFLEERGVDAPPVEPVTDDQQPTLDLDPDAVCGTCGAETGKGDPHEPECPEDPAATE